jgi:hypothetical protein
VSFPQDFLSLFSVEKCQEDLLPVIPSGLTGLKYGYYEVNLGLGFF